MQLRHVNNREGCRRQHLATLTLIAEGEKMAHCEGLQQREVQSCWRSAGSSSRQRFSRLWLRLAKLECTPCCEEESYAPSSVSTSKRCTALQPSVRPTPSDKKDGKQVSYAWRMLYWKDVQQTRLNLNDYQHGSANLWWYARRFGSFFAWDPVTNVHEYGRGWTIEHILVSIDLGL